MRNMKNKKSKTKMIVAMLVYALFSLNVITMASSTGTTAISAPLGTLLNIVTDLVTGIGAIITLYGIFEFGNAQQSQDGSAKAYAIQRITGGLVMVVAPQLLQLFVN